MEIGNWIDKEKVMHDSSWIGFFVVLAAVAAMTGCSGLEVGGKLGVYAVDERQDSSRTYKRPPLKCMFVACPQANEEVQGS